MAGFGELMVLPAELEVLTPSERSEPTGSAWREVQASGVVVREIGTPDGLEAEAAWSKLDTEDRHP
jgi:hypothetical protein